MTMDGELSDDELWAAFGAAALPAPAWTHRAHLRVAWMHLARWPAIDEAHLRMRVGIIRLNLAHGLEETATRGYHETLTRVWLALVRHARGLDAAGSSEEFLDRHAELLDREAPLRHYTRERLFALEARTIFVAPDRAALPA